MFSIGQSGRDEFATTNQKYYDEASSYYDRLFCDPVSLAENAVVQELLFDLIRPASKVLDHGCGTGLGYELLKEWVASYVGLDISPEMIALANQSERSNATFRQSNMDDPIPFEGESFDAVTVLFGSFSHCAAPERFAAEVLRVLRPGGSFFVMSYSRMSLRNMIAAAATSSTAPLAAERDYRVRRDSQIGNGARARFYAASDLASVFRGFEQVTVRGLNILPDSGVGLPADAVGANSVSEAQDFLHREMLTFAAFPDLAHSLIVSGRKGD